MAPCDMAMVIPLNGINQRDSGDWSGMYGLDVIKVWLSFCFVCLLCVCLCFFLCCIAKFQDHKKQGSESKRPGLLCLCNVLKCTYEIMNLLYAVMTPDLVCQCWYLTGALSFRCLMGGAVVVVALRSTWAQCF